MILKKVQDLSNMLDMSFPRLTIDVNVIKQYKEKSPEIRFHNFIHEDLNGGSCIVKSKRHNQKIIISFMGEKSSLRNVFLFHPNLWYLKRRSNLVKY